MQKPTTFSSSYRNTALLLFTLGVLILSAMVLLPFVAALLWATVLSILFSGMYAKLREKWEKKPLLKDGRAATLASLVTTVVALLAICVPFVLIGAGLYVQYRGISSGADNPQDRASIESVLRKTDEGLKSFYETFGHPEFSLAQAWEENQTDIAAAVQEPAKQAARKLGITLFTLVISLLTMFFMLRDGHRLKEPTLELLPLPRERSLAMLERIRETVFAVFVGTVFVAIIQGTLIGIAYAIAGVPSALLLGVLSAVASLIPLLGTPIIYIPVGLFLLATGNVGGAAIVLLSGFLLVSQIDNILRPFFIGGRTNLHPMGVFFSILGGVLLFGPVGVMAGPMLLTVLLALQEVLRERMQADEPQVITQAT